MSSHKTHAPSGMTAAALTVLIVLWSAAHATHAAVINLQNATATGSQPSLPVGALIDNLYPGSNAGGDGWADDIGGVTSPQVAVFETATDLDLSAGGVVRFNLFQGWSASHTVGKYRFSYTTDDRSTFADGLANGGDVTATWTEFTPTSAISSGGATLTIQGDNSILASGTDPSRTTDTVYATVGPIAQPITGFRIETLADASLPDSGPGRAGNGNYVARELDIAAFVGSQVPLQNGTAIRSQGGFSVDNAIDGKFPFTSTSGEGWANSGLDSNVAAFETVSDINTPDAHITDLTVELFSGGFSFTHTLGKFRISATTDDRSLFADGLDNAGDVTANWVVLNPTSVTSDNPTTTFTVDKTGAILAGGTGNIFEMYTITLSTYLSGITGFRLEALEDPSLPGNGPGRASNSNFVVREFTIFSNARPVPEPATASLGLLTLAALALRRRRDRMA